MLREWNGTSNEPLLVVLKQYDVKPQEMRLHKYEAITPDSFIWCITVKENNKWTPYYLYAEDYIGGTQQVIDAIEDNLASWTPNDKIELVPVIKQAKWEQSEPVKLADTYAKPEKPAEMMKFATQSGYDFVFLAKVITTEA